MRLNSALASSCYLQDSDWGFGLTNGFTRAVR